MIEKSARFYPPSRHSGRVCGHASRPVFLDAQRPRRGRPRIPPRDDCGRVERSTATRGAGALLEEEQDPERGEGKGEKGGYCESVCVPAAGVVSRDQGVVCDGER